METKEIGIEQTERAIEHRDGSMSFNKKTLNQDAVEATIAEHSLSLWRALVTYRKAIFWSVVVSTSIVMEGYDTTLLGTFMGYPTFRQKYGEDYGGDAGYQLSSAWQAGLGDASAIGNIIGAIGNGYFTDIYGHRTVMLANLLAMTGFIFIVFFAPNTPVLLVGEFLCSIPWGVFATMGPAFAAEVCPLALRGYLTAYVNLCWAIGQLLSAAILKALLHNTTEWGYRIPFAIQWIWPIPLGLALWFCPDSPWWLVRQGRLEDAARSLKRLSQDPNDEDIKQTVALMVHTTEYEKTMEEGASYWDCFKGTNLRRTEIACGAFLSQITDGGAFAYSPIYFFEQAGITADAAYGIGLGGTGIAFCGTVLSWFLMSRFGRRTIFLFGFAVLVSALYIIAILACVPNATTSLGIQYTQATLCLIWLGVYSLTVGPIVYTIVAEIGATRLRTKTVVLGRSTYYVGNIIGGVMEPYMMNPTQWNWKGKTAFFWGTLSLLTTIWAWFRLPETKDRTFEELDILFDKGVSARQFSKYQFGEGEVGGDIAVLEEKS